MLLLSFGQESQAISWIQETKAPFPLLLDTERSVYRAYGLERSFVKSWHPRIMLHYLALPFKGRKLHPIQGDPNQLGGDFIVDAQGTVRFSHYRQAPSDRPSFQRILEALKKLKIAQRENSFL